MTKELTLRMPDNIHTILANLRTNFRISVNSTIMNYIARGLIKDGLYPIEIIRKRPQEAINMIPEELKFCDGDKCAVPIIFTEHRGRTI